jgi:hypothetical protein
MNHSTNEGGLDMNTLRISLVLCLIVGIGTVHAANVTSAASGVWSATATWQGGVLPGTTDTVIIRNGDTVTIDMAATCAGLQVNGVFQVSKTVVVDMIINGNLTVNTGATFKVQTAVTSFTGPHTLMITGNITNAGSIFDLRSGTAGGNLGVINVTFGGSTNSVVTMVPAYTSTNGDFNAVTINKTGGARVILASDMFINGGSSTGPQTMTSILTFVNGVVETGNFALIHQTSTAANVTGASAASYVLGAMGRGMSNSVGSSKEFPVGDASGYRPFNLRSTTSGLATGHFATVRLVHANANTGSSTLAGGIDRVSAVRYYKVTYTSGAGAASMSFDRFYPTYGTDDGVTAGNTDLRVANSTNDRSTWTGFTQNSYPHTTDLTNPPTQIKPDSLSPAVNLASGTGAIYVALARLTGTTTNTLGGSSAVLEEEGIPARFFVARNYPNPFNPSTTIRYGLPLSGFVTLKVHNTLGQEVATLVNEHQVAGVHQVSFNATQLPSGMYFYTVRMNGLAQTGRMMLVK